MKPQDVYESSYQAKMAANEKNDRWLTLRTDDDIWGDGCTVVVEADGAYATMSSNEEARFLGIETSLKTVGEMASSLPAWRVRL